MKLPLDKNKFTAGFRYVEVGHYVPELNKLIRDKNGNEPLLIDYEEVASYSQKYNQTGIFQSVFQYNSQHLDSAAFIGPLFFDIDSDDPAVSKDEATRLVNYLISYFPEGAIRAYFSGQKGFHVECHPGDQTILTAGHGYVKVKDLDESVHRLVAYDKGKNRIRRFVNGTEQGVPFSRSSRQYTGQMLTFNVDDYSFNCTPNHHLNVSWNQKGMNSHVVYLMRKGIDWRIGYTKLFSKQNKPRLKVRMCEEDADSIWILGLFDTEQEALIHETLWSFEFGIPQIVFTPSRYFPKNKMTDDQARYIYENLNTNLKVDRLFNHFNLDKTLPFRTKTTQSFHDVNVNPLTKRFKLTAINFIPGYMEMATDVQTQIPKWTDNINVSSSDFHGEVYNISMENYHHYVASGTVVHNCEPIAFNVSPTDDLPRIFRFIAGYVSEQLELSGIDYHVYDRRRMWRVPNTRHQRTGLFKVECLQLLRNSSTVGEISALAEHPVPVEVPEQKPVDTAIRWYSEMKAAWEESVNKSKQYYSSFDNFIRTGAVYSQGTEHKIFDPSSTLNNCNAVKVLYDKARSQHYLDHYERLFLCSLLTYTEEAINFLHKEILSHCADYNFVISDSHIQDWIRRRENGSGGRPFTCDKAKEVGIICSTCDTLKPINRRINNHVIENDYSAPSPVRFIYSYIKDEQNGR